MRKLFKKWGIEAQYVDAFDADSPIVRILKESQLVARHPPCFRCGKDLCNCPNKELQAPQVANWLSHMQAWFNVKVSQSSGLHLICEDDIEFSDRSLDVLQNAFSDLGLKTALHAKAPCLLRLGWAWCEDHTSPFPAGLSRDLIKMANPCYAINPAFAEVLLSGVTRFDTTSDIYIHRIASKSIAHFTIMPPIATDLSWSFGSFRSEIRPKDVRITFLKQQLLAAHSRNDRVAAAKVEAEIDFESRRPKDRARLTMILKCWKGGGPNNEIWNWGDAVSPEIFRLVTGHAADLSNYTDHNVKSPSLLMCGSTLKWATEHSILWGTGAIIENHAFVHGKPSSIDARLVRGPLTREGVAKFRL